jgi:hypothetical protein
MHIQALVPHIRNVVRHEKHHLLVVRAEGHIEGPAEHIGTRCYAARQIEITPV